MTKRLFFVLSFIAVIVILPIIYAQSIEDTIKQQIGVNSANYKIAQDINPNDVLREALKNDPELQKQVRNFFIVFAFLIILLLIDLILKGFAMWKASKKNSKIWFWIILLINTMGILPLLYLIFSKKPENDKKK